MNFIPHYIKLYESGELTDRKEILLRRLQNCDICPLTCHVDRSKNEIARCYSGALPIVSSYCPHFGEEPLLTGTRGVGNIFFGNCNLRCVYCQNYQISQNWRNEVRHEVSIERLAEIMLELQNVHRCHSVGLVSPTHFVPQIVEALEIAIECGFILPLVYNTNCYDDISVIGMLEGIVDIYLPDLKYAYDQDAGTYSKVSEYVSYSRVAVKEMFRQVGDKIIIGEDGTVKRGLIIRHLILPNMLAGSEETLRFIHDELSNNVTISLMSQYYPTNKLNSHNADNHFELRLLNRKIRKSEYDKALALLDKFGFENGWTQAYQSTEYYVPDFEIRHEPFVDRKDFVKVI